MVHNGRLDLFMQASQGRLEGRTDSLGTLNCMSCFNSHPLMVCKVTSQDPGWNCKLSMARWGSSWVWIPSSHEGNARNIKNLMEEEWCSASSKMGSVCIHLDQRTCVYASCRIQLNTMSLNPFAQLEVKRVPQSVGQCE